MNTGTQPHDQSAGSAPPSTRTLDWLVSNFVRGVSGLSQAILV